MKIKGLDKKLFINIVFKGQILGQLTPVCLGILSLNAPTALGTTPASISDVSQEVINPTHLMELPDQAFQQAEDSQQTVKDSLTVEPESLEENKQGDTLSANDQDWDGYFIKHSQSNWVKYSQLDAGEEPVNSKAQKVEEKEQECQETENQDCFGVLDPNPIVTQDNPHLQDFQISQISPTTPNPETIQPNPDERFPQPTPVPEPLRPDDSSPLIQPESTPSNPTTPNVQTIEIQKINVTGSTIFSTEDFNPITQPLEGQAVTLKQLQQVADAITQLYLSRGYITSRAILVDQVITNGIVEIFILEGSLEEIKIEGIRRLQPSYIHNRIQLGVSKPLNTARLEDKLRLLRANPLFDSVEASLRAGSEPGKSNLIIRVVEANPLNVNLTTDNYSPSSVGSERLGVNGQYRNLTGVGDELTASYFLSTTGGSTVLDLGYRFPLNAKNGIVQVQASVNRNQVTAEPFAEFGIQGESQEYEISFRQPLVRTSSEEFALSLSLGIREGQTFLLNEPFPLSAGADADGITRTSIIQFGQDYLHRDAKGAWSVRSLFSLGTGWFNATINPDPLPDGRFLSWLGQIQRVQILSNTHLLIMGADIQLTPNVLLPAQQFVLGGGQSVRGYRQNARIGDNGVRFFVENRITLERNISGVSTFQIVPFLNGGWVWNHPDNLNPLPQEQFLASLGLGILWQPLPGLDLRLDYGIPLVKLEDQGENAQDKGFHFSIRYQF